MAQSLISDFEVSISYFKCNYVRAYFHFNGSIPTDCDSVCWDFGDEQVSCNSSVNWANHSYTQHGLYTVKLTLWKDGIETQIIKPDLIIVYKPLEVFFSYTVSDSLLYAPLEVEFINQTIPGDGDSITYSWSLNSLCEPNDTTFTCLFEEPQTYYIMLMGWDNNGCMDIYEENIIVRDTLQVNEFEFLTGGCTDGTDPSCPEGVHYKIENDSLKIFGQVTRNCCMNHTAVIIDKIDTIQIPTFSTGISCDCECIYCFKINIPNFQRDSCVIVFDNNIFTVYSGINSIPESYYFQTVSITPNPFGDCLNIVFKKTSNSDYKIQIFDLKGSLLISKMTCDNQINLNTFNLSKGVFLLIITEKNILIHKEKIIKN